MLPGFVVSMWERSDRPTRSQVVECSPGRLSKNSLVYHIILSHCINMTVVYYKEDFQQFPLGSSFTMCLLFDSISSHKAGVLESKKSKYHEIGTDGFLGLRDCWHQFSAFIADSDCI